MSGAVGNETDRFPPQCASRCNNKTRKSREHDGPRGQYEVGDQKKTRGGKKTVTGLESFPPVHPRPHGRKKRRKKRAPQSDERTAQHGTQSVESLIVQSLSLSVCFFFALHLSISSTRTMSSMFSMSAGASVMGMPFSSLTRNDSNSSSNNDDNDTIDVTAIEPNVDDTPSFDEVCGDSVEFAMQSFQNDTLPVTATTAAAAEINNNNNNNNHTTGTTNGSSAAIGSNGNKKQQRKKRRFTTAPTAAAKECHRIVNSLTVDQCQNMPYYKSHGCKVLYMYTNQKPWAACRQKRCNATMTNDSNNEPNGLLPPSDSFATTAAAASTTNTGTATTCSIMTLHDTEEDAIRALAFDVLLDEANTQGDVPRIGPTGQLEIDTIAIMAPPLPNHQSDSTAFDSSSTATVAATATTAATTGGGTSITTTAAQLPNDGVIDLTEDNDNNDVGRGSHNVHGVQSSTKRPIEIIDCDDDDDDSDDDTECKTGGHHVDRDWARRLRQKVESDLMMSNPTGQAWNLLSRVTELYKRLLMQNKTNGLKPLPADDIFTLTERFVKCKAHFQELGRDTHASCGYHYTKSTRLSSIVEHGLMSLPEREKNNVHSHRGGAVFGYGIYTARNPTCFRHYGDVGLLLAKIHGNQEYVTQGRFNPDEFVDTYIGNKRTRYSLTDQHDKTKNDVPPEHPHDEIVLRQAQQCLPLFSYPTDLTWTDSNLKDLFFCQQEMQKLLDDFFNGNVATFVNDWASSPDWLGNSF